MTPDFAPLPGTAGRLTESPVWDAVNGALLWCDILEGEIHELRLGDGARRSWHFSAPVGSFGLAAGSRLVVACLHDVLLLDRDDGSRTMLARIEDGMTRTRLNDGKVGPDGAFWVGSMDDTPPKEPIAALYRVTPDGQVVRKVDGLITSNGLAWSADGRVMFHSDSRGRRLDVYDFDPTTGEMTAGRVLARLDDKTGRPDGGATDSSGIYWSAGVTAGQLNQFTAAERAAAQPGFSGFGADHALFRRPGHAQPFRDLVAA